MQSLTAKLLHDREASVGTVQPCLRQRRDGRWKAYLQDSATNQKMCLGSYATFEEASRVANDYAARQIPQPLSPSSALKQMDLTTPRSRSRPNELPTCMPPTHGAQPTEHAAVAHATIQQHGAFDSPLIRNQRGRRHSDTRLSAKVQPAHPWVRAQAQPLQQQPWLIPHAVHAAGSAQAGAGHASGPSADPAASWATEEAWAHEGRLWGADELPLARCVRMSEAPGSSRKQRTADPESSAAATTFIMAGSSDLAAASDAAGRCRLLGSSPALASAAVLPARQARRPSSRYDSSSSSAECSGQHSCSSSPERARQGPAAASQLPEALSLGSEVPLSPYSLGASRREDPLESGSRRRAVAAPARRAAAAALGMRRSSSCADVGRLQLARLTAASADSQVSALQAQLAAAEANAAKQKLLLQQQLAEARLAAKAEQRRLKEALMAAGDATVGGGHPAKPCISPRKRPPPLDSILEQPGATAGPAAAPYLHRPTDVDTHAHAPRDDGSRLQSPRHSLTHGRCLAPSPRAHAAPRAPRPHAAPRSSAPLHPVCTAPQPEEGSFNARDLAAARAQSHCQLEAHYSHSHKQGLPAATAPAPTPAGSHYAPDPRYPQLAHYPPPYTMQHAMQHPAPPPAAPYSMQHPMSHSMHRAGQYMQYLPHAQQPTMHWYADAAAACEPRAGGKPQKKRRHSAVPALSGWANPQGLLAPSYSVDSAAALAASAALLGVHPRAAGASAASVPAPASAAHHHPAEGHMHVLQAEAYGTGAVGGGMGGSRRQVQGAGQCEAQPQPPCLGAVGPQPGGAAAAPAPQDAAQPSSPLSLGSELSQLLRSFLQESDPEPSGSGAAAAAAGPAAEAAAEEAPCSSQQQPHLQPQAEAPLLQASAGSLQLFSQYSSFLDSGAGAEAELAAGVALLGADDADAGQQAINDLGTWLGI